MDEVNDARCRAKEIQGMLKSALSWTGILVGVFSVLQVENAQAAAGIGGAHLLGKANVKSVFSASTGGKLEVDPAQVSFFAVACRTNGGIIDLTINKLGFTVPEDSKFCNGTGNLKGMAIYTRTEDGVIRKMDSLPAGETAISAVARAAILNKLVKDRQANHQKVVFDKNGTLLENETGTLQITESREELLRKTLDLGDQIAALNKRVRVDSDLLLSSKNELNRCRGAFQQGSSSSTSQVKELDALVVRIKAATAGAALAD